jgi:NTE family protein
LKIPGNVVLVLAGGNALGVYEAGAYEALHERGVEPSWIAGASIGAVTGAIVAGNPREKRIAQLRRFWRLAEQFGKPDPSGKAGGGRGPMYEKRAAATQALIAGRPGLFAPRIPGLWSALPGMPGDVSLFDTKPLLRTLEKCVDFDLLNRGSIRLTVAAVNVETGEDVFFDNADKAVHPEHLRASTAFLVTYPPVEIDGRVLVDPGISANLPLRAVLSSPPEVDTLCIAVDLVSGRGKRPRSIGDAVQRAQDLLFASHSRHTIEALRAEYRLRAVVRDLLDKVPADRRSGLDLPADLAERNPQSAKLLHVVYSEDEHETAAKMFDYSEASIRERWAAGFRDMRHALDALEKAPEPNAVPGLAAYRLAHNSFSRYS